MPRLLLLILSLGAAVSRVAGQATVNSVGSTNTTGYILAADAGDGNAATNRHLTAVTAQVNITTAGNYRADWALLDPAGTAVGTGTNAISSAPATGVRTVTGTIAPSVTLAAGVLYKVRINVVLISSGATVATRTEVAGQAYLHLAGTSATSTAVNALGIINSVTIDRDWLLEGDATTQSIPVAVNWTLHRYDNWSGSNDPKTVPLNFAAALKKNSDSTTTVITTTVPAPAAPVIDSFADLGGGLKGPATATGSTVLQLNPSAMLGLLSWFAEVTVSHTDTAPSTVVTGNTKSSPARDLLHLSGALACGGINATYSHLAVDPLTYAGAPADVPGVEVYRRLKVDQQSGRIVGRTDYTWGDGAAFIKVKVVATGNATLLEGSMSVDAANAAARQGTVNGVSYKRTGALTLDTTGAHSTLRVQLPDGIGWAPDKLSGLLDSEVDFNASATLNQSLQPGGIISILPAPGTFFLCEQTKPFYIECASLAWHITAGELRAGNSSVAHSIRQPLLDFMASFSAAYAAPTMVSKKSNEHLYNRVTSIANAVVKTGSSGAGELTGTLAIGAGNFVTHFPHGTAVAWTAPASVQITGDLITPATSNLPNAQPLAMNYARHTETGALESCGGTSTALITFTPAASQLKFTADGGLQAAGTAAMDRLAWGYIHSNDSTTTPPGGTATATLLDDNVQRVNNAFTGANFLMSGTFLRGDGTAAANRTGSLLLSGFDPANLSTAERPLSAEYLVGAADYPGLNFRTPGNFHARSTLQGAAYGPYTLTARSKYYVRPSGVSGIHEAAAGTFAGATVLSGYQFTLNHFGFSYLSNAVHDSRTDGTLTLPPPVGVLLDFTELNFDDFGGLASLDLARSTALFSKQFQFWSAPFTQHSAEFIATKGCDPARPATLALGFTAHAARFSEDITGTLGIKPDGFFATPADSIALVAESVPRRVTLPPQMKLAGKDTDAGATYTFFPSTGAYLNSQPDQLPRDSFWSFFGSLDAPFFRDVQVHLHARPQAANTTTPVYIMGGWPDHGWKIAGKTPFQNASFDANNDGWPQGTPLDTYRRIDSGAAGVEWLPRARQEWLGLLKFDYPIRWNGTRRIFTGQRLDGIDVIVATVGSSLQYMDSQQAEIQFGAEYQGLPVLSLTNLAYDALDEGTGAASAIVHAQADKAFKALQNGVDEFAVMLDDKAAKLLDTALDKALDAPIDAFVAEVKTMIGQGLNTEAQVKALVDARFRQANGSINVALGKLGGAVNAGESVLADLDDRLRRVELAIDALIAKVTIDPYTGVILIGDEVANGIMELTDDDGDNKFRRDVMNAVGVSLVGTLELLTTATKTADGRTIEQIVKDTLDKLDPSIAKVVEALTAVKDTVHQLRTGLSQAGSMGRQLQELINDSAADLMTAAQDAADDAEEMILDFAAQQSAQLDAVAEEWKVKIRRRITDSLNASPLIAKIQSAIRQRIYDLNTVFQEAIDTAFATLNEAIKTALSDVLSLAQENYDQAHGQLGEKVGSAGLNGVAHITGDSVDSLRLDGRFQFKVPDNMDFHAFLSIREMDSDGPSGCGGSTTPTVEIMTGAYDVPFNWIAPGLHADLSVKYNVSTTVPPLPLGMGGSFQMTSGYLEYKAFDIEDIGAAVMISVAPDGDPAKIEAYLAAQAALQFQKLRMAGGLFFGRACSLDPIELIDPLAAQVIGAPPFTGYYVYGEASIPILGTGTCLFDVSAKAGAGIFAFAEGPTVGGRMTLGISGEALCALEIAGQVSMIGTQGPNGFRFAGEGNLYGRAGICPACLEFNETLSLIYQNSDFKFDF